MSLGTWGHGLPRDPQPGLVLRLCRPGHRSRAEGVRGTAEAVQQALEEARQAQAVAEQALQRATGDIQHSERALGMVRAPSLRSLPHRDGQGPVPTMRAP